MMVFDDDRNIRSALAHIDDMIVHSGECLIAVLEKYDGELRSPVQFILLFAGRHIDVDVRAEDDSVALSINADTQSTLVDTLPNVSRSMPWQQAIGKSLAGCCIMLNNRGYVDGVQFEFSNSIMENSIYVQIVGAGSSLHIRQIIEATTLNRLSNGPSSERN
jgi:hypothetical protein